jgi:hypothetical protein
MSTFLHFVLVFSKFENRCWLGSTVLYACTAFLLVVVSWSWSVLSISCLFEFVFGGCLRIEARLRSVCGTEKLSLYNVRL